jgi:glycosyltransferase involved in cell wall biosynthesis
MGMPTVSIIIPCYNQGIYLDDAIQSVLAQTFQDFEVIVVDDGSTAPETQAILDQARYHRTVIVRTPNLGLAGARNLGISRASGRYILPLDCDDRIGERYLEKAVPVLEHDPACGIVYCKAEYFGTQTGAWVLPAPSFPELLFQPAIFCSALFRREDWKKVGGYNPSLVHGYEDHDFWLALLETGRSVVRIEETLFYYRRTPGSMAQSITLEQQVQAYGTMLKRHRSLFVNNLDTLFRLYLQAQAAVSLRHRLLAQVFVPDGGAYSESASTRLEYATHGETEIVLALPDTFDRSSALPLRFDPGMRSGCYELSSVKLEEQRSGQTIASLLDVAGNGAVKAEGTSFLVPAPQHLRLYSYGTDPQLWLYGFNLLQLPAGSFVLRVRLRYTPDPDHWADSFAVIRDLFLKSQSDGCGHISH